jgi:PTS system ascorbate-specific IIB component
MLIYAVCGAGIGTSVLLKSNAERALTLLGIEAEVRAVSIEEARGTNKMAQVVLATPELLDQLAGIPAEVIAINNIFDLAELGEKLKATLS